MSLAPLISFLLVQVINLNSPDGRFTIKLYARDIGDASSELSYYLLENGKKDSTLLTTSLIHDMTVPGFWWTQDSKRLVFEHKHEGDSISINVFDTSLQSIVFSTTGYVNAPVKKWEIYFDPLKRVILFYKPTTQRKIQIFTLDVGNLETRVIGEFENWDHYETPNLTKLDNETGEINVAVRGADYCPKTVILNLYGDNPIQKSMPNDH